MPQVALVLLLVFFLHAPLAIAEVAQVRRLLLLESSSPVAALAAAPGPADCPVKCGDVCIPYPFVISDGEHVDPELDDFNITCDVRYSPPRPYYFNIEIISISLQEGVIVVYTPVVYRCYNSINKVDSSYPVDISVPGWLNLTGTPFLISPGSNEFTAIGCDALAFLDGRDDFSFFTGCITSCQSVEDASKDGEQCTGLGCCQVPSVPTNLSSIEISWSIEENNTAWSYSPCKYAFVAQKGRRNRYTFKRQDLGRDGIKRFENRDGEASVRTVLDWAIRSNGTCLLPPPESATNSSVAPACVSNHSNCFNATNGKGYLCNCSKGYAGNPYIVGGCTNINECELRKAEPGKYEKLYPCSGGSTCDDTEGDYNCKCRVGSRRDGNNDKLCRPILPAPAAATLATIGAAIILVILVSYIIWEHERRKRKSFADKNGGKHLKDLGVTIFRKEQLDKMMNKNGPKIRNGIFGKFCMNKNHHHTEIGAGAFGKVYRGTTEENQQVAIKCSRSQKINERHKGDFVTEIRIQMNISHANLVRLVGCCLETDVPMLVFEFISNGSLDKVLHEPEHWRHLSLLQRLNIAVGSAEALAYMHSKGHVHGDVKPSNILLDEDLMPKVSDFGSSKLTIIARSSRTVSGDQTYTDPTYMKTGSYTEKSDVYSFGIVILELITRKKARYGVSSHLSISFVKAYKDVDSRMMMYDQKILLLPDAVEALGTIGGIAVQCLKEDADERPTMAEVVEKLTLVRSTVVISSPQ